MKLLDLQLLAYGAFTEHKFDMSDERRGLHIIYGTNEAGKSTALRGVAALLFGIPRLTGDNYLHENARMRIGGTLRHSDGRTLEIIRRKGNKDTLLDTQGNPIPESTLLPFLGGITEEQFRTMFGIDHTALRAGGQAILDEGGEVGQSLFNARLGGTSVQGILAALDADASALFRPRGHDQRINAIIRAYQEAQYCLKAQQLSTRTWEEQERTVRRLTKERDLLVQEMTQFTKEATRLQRIKLVRPAFARRSALQEKLAALGEVCRVPADYATTVPAWMSTLTQTREALAQAEQMVTQLEGQLSALAVRDELIAVSEKLTDLHQRLGSYKKADVDRVGLSDQVELREAQVVHLLAELPPSLPGNIARNLVLTKIQRTGIRTLSEQYQRLESAREQADKALQKSMRDLCETAQALEGIDIPRDMTELQTVITRCRQAGDIEKALLQAQETLKDRERVAAAELQRIPLWHGTLLELTTLPVPALESIERFAAALQQREVEAKRLDQRHDELTAQFDTTAQQLTQLRLAGEVPTVVDLHDARARRDSGWQLVRRAWLDGTDIAEEAARYAQEPLAEAYEQAVFTADAVSDRLRREATRVTQCANLLAQRERLEKDIAENAERITENNAAVATCQAEWELLWQPTGITPRTPIEMRAWQGKLQSLLLQMVQLTSCQQECERQQRQYAALQTAIINALVNIGEQCSHERESYTLVLARAEAVFERQRQQAQQRENCETRLAEIRRQLTDAQNELSSLDNEKCAWQQAWKAAIQPLLLPETTSSVDVAIVLEMLDGLRTTVHEIDGLQKRIAGIERDAQIFREDVRALTVLLGLRQQGYAIESLVAELHEQLVAARENATKRSAWQEQVKEQQQTVGTAKDKIALLEQRLDECCRLLGCPTLEELMPAIERAQQVAEFTDDIEEIEVDLLTQGEGLLLEDLAREVAAVSADDLTVQLAEIHRQLAEREPGRSTLDQQIGEAQKVLADMDGGPRATETAEEAQGHLAALQAPVESYLRLRLAAYLLREEVERYRAANQHPVLARAGEFFARFTLRHYTGVGTEYGDNDELVLLGSKASGDIVPVASMSDGALDQLYLALRLATLERYIATNEPLPFVADDILISFDDDRASAALEVLAEFSTQTQVIFFTHHARLVELARQLPADTICVHELTAEMVQV